MFTEFHGLTPAARCTGPLWGIRNRITVRGEEIGVYWTWTGRSQVCLVMVLSPMRNPFIEIGLPLLAALVGMVLLAQWYVGARPTAVAPRPLVEQRNDEAPRPEVVSTQPNVANSATNLPPIAPPTAAPTTATTAAVLPGAWPAYRGALRDGVSADPTPLARTWGAQGPPRLWSLTLGEGYAGAVVRDGKVYVLDYDLAALSDVLRCFTLADGRELWRTAYSAPIGKQHGLSRTVPAVSEKYVVSLGPRCHVLCVDAATGTRRWLHDLVKEYGSKVPEWYAGQCPLIDGDRAIIAPGGSALLVAFDGATGKEVWRTPNPKKWQMTHSSILPVTIAGTRMYVYCASDGVVGVSAETGKVLWETSAWVVRTANIPTPLDLGDGKLFFSGGYGAGCMLAQVKKVGGAFQVDTVFTLKESVFGAYQQTPIYYQGNIYAVIPNGQLACLATDGTVRWRSGPAKRFAWNAYTLAGGMLYLLTDAGELVLVEANVQAYRELARATVLPGGREFWAPMAVAGRRLILRDLTTMVCLDIGR